MADFAVSTLFKSIDGVSQTLKKMGVSANKFGLKTSAAFDRANRKGLTFKSTLGAILSARVIGRGTALLGQGIRGVTEEFINFDDAITKAGAKFPVVAKRGSESFLALEKTARNVGATTKFSATEAGEGLDFLAMAGFNAEQAMAALPQVTNLATVADTDLARATDIASDALGSFNLMTKDSAQLTENLTRVNDVFAKTVTSANTDIENLFEAIKDGGPVATSAGASIETTAALIGKMANAGIKGSKAGTTLKNMFIRLQDPPAEAARVIRKLGIQLVDNEGKLRDITDILGDFNDKTTKMGKAQKAAAISTVFGKRAIAGVSVLLAEGRDSLKEYRQTLIESGGAADDMAKIIEGSLGNRLKALRSAAIEAGLKFFDAFKKKVPNAIDTAVEAVRKFDVKGAIEGIKEFAKFIKNTVAVLRELRPLIETVIIFTLAYKTALMAVTAIQAISFYWNLVSALKGAAGAQGILNAVMLANPIGLVVVAVGLLITAGVMLWRQWDNIKVLWNLLVSDMKDGIRRATEAFKNSGFGKFIISTIDTIIEKWKWIKKNVFRQKVEGPKVTTAAGARQAKVQAALEANRARQQARLAAAPKAIGRGTVRGIGTTPAPAREAPNKEDVAAQKINFFGKLTVAGAPEGSKLEGTTEGAPPISLELAGFNI